MLERLQRRIRGGAHAVPRDVRDQISAERPFGPETPEEAAARVTDRNAALQRVVVHEESGAASPSTPVRPSSPGTWSALRPSSVPRLVLVMIGLAGALVALRELRELSSLVAPVFFALNLMITAYPLQRVLVRRGAPKWLGSIVAGLAVLLALGFVIFGLSYGVAAMVGELPKYDDQFTALYNQTLAWLTRLGFDQTVLVKALKGIDPSSVLTVVTNLLSNASGVASLVVVVLTTLIFMVMDAAQIEQRMGAARRSHPSFVMGLESFAQGIRKYWLVSTAFGLVVAAVDYVILIGVGVPLALVWALFSFLTNYIPNIGFVIGVVPPALLALVEGGWKPAVIVVVAYSLVNFIIQSIIQPRVAGDAVGLTPTLSFLSLLLWGWVFGGLGALIALPLSLLVKALLVDVDPQVRWANTLISSRISDGDPLPAVPTPESV
ncbi:putative PurR-regulated permease PerM [Luteococcus japonicus]|uniref:COG0628: Predicted permease n=2 Tax=Luteococcus japonicus TaxID=33984 RepID=A0A1R4IT82_9ACTN|nr:AI-2E family transporter [Luteococcus japonicus]ROR53572.1 putative PurR-regulated permease PerM [Luteococcus japonicus]SJN22765.1 COG0628: Predicted permease [Luteococcus japonicus LSP_Lj1]